MTTWNRAAAGLVLGILAAALPTSAAAEDAALPDQRDDRWVRYVEEPGQPVRRYDYSPDDTFGPAPDIVRTKYRHLPRKVRVVLRMRHFHWGYFELTAHYRTNEGLERRAKLFADLSAPNHLTYTWSGRHDCAMQGTLSRRDDRVVLDVPRRCLGEPRRVRMVSKVEWWPTSDEASPVFDVSAKPGYGMSNWSEPLSRG